MPLQSLMNGRGLVGGGGGGMCGTVDVCVSEGESAHIGMVCVCVRGREIPLG